MLYQLSYKGIGADDQVRTGDIGLGRTALYQLSYIRKLAGEEGLEPSAYDTKNRCSTIELLSNISNPCSSGLIVV